MGLHNPIRRKAQGTNLAQRAGTRPEWSRRPAPSKAERRSRKGLSHRARKATALPITRTPEALIGSRQQGGSNPLCFRCVHRFGLGGRQTGDHSKMGYVRNECHPPQTHAYAPMCGTEGLALPMKNAWLVVSLCMRTFGTGCFLLSRPLDQR